MGNDSSENESQAASFEDLLDEVEQYDRPKRGDIRPAIILQINPDEIIVDLGVKRDGVVPKDDLIRLTSEFLDSLNTGDEVPIYVLNPNDRDGNLLVSINLGLQGQDWVRAHKLLENGELVEAEVTGFNRGGLLVRFGRLEGFVPASHVLGLDPGLPEPDRSQAMDDLIGTTIGLKVVEVNQGRRRLILSQREAQREWRSQQKKRLLHELSVGDVTTGRITGIRDFGVFVDLGGADGLIHVSELAWHRVPHPRDVVKVGDEVQVHVLELDHDKQRIALSLRRVHADPWPSVEQTYLVGQAIEGMVSNVVDFGAFVVLEDGIEGLLHVSEMADGQLSEPYSYVKRGDRVTVRVARIEADRRRIGFTQQGLDLQGPTDVPDVSVNDSPPSEGAEQTDADTPEEIGEEGIMPPEMGAPEELDQQANLTDTAEETDEEDTVPPEMGTPEELDQQANLTDAEEEIDEEDTAPPEMGTPEELDQQANLTDAEEEVDEEDTAPPENEDSEEADTAPSE
jgi:small subunit ribosomal protein S1